MHFVRNLILQFNMQTEIKLKDVYVKFINKICWRTKLFMNISSCTLAILKLERVGFLWVKCFQFIFKKLLKFISNNFFHKKNVNVVSFPFSNLNLWKLHSQAAVLENPCIMSWIMNASLNLNGRKSLLWRKYLHFLINSL